MSEAELMSLETELKSLAEDDLREPTVPVAAYCHQAEQMSRALEQDRAEILATGIEPILLETLSTRLGALRFADARYQIGRVRGRPEDQVKREEEGFVIRNGALADARWGLRKVADAQKKLDAIAEGDGLMDMIDDLEKVAEVYRVYAALFLIPQYDPFAQAETLDQRAAEIRAGSAAWHTDASQIELKDTRDRAFTYAHLAVQEIRQAARYAFRKETTDKRITPYRDQYSLNKARRARTKKLKELKDLIVS